MNFTIHSDGRSAVISSIGAELRSLKNTRSGEEYLWQGDPAIWSGRAPILFPIVGGLKDDRYRVDGDGYSMDKHGFARKREFTCLSQSDHRLVFQLVDDEATRAIYPWRFSLQVEFHWQADQLVISYGVANRDEAVLLFNIGSHPAFRLPLGPDHDHSTIEDYHIVFSASETLDTWSIVDALLDPSPTPYLSEQRDISLTERIFDHDALVFRNIRSRQLTLTHARSGKRVIVSTGGAPHLGIWAKPAASFVCIEPWWGHADFSDATGLLNDKVGIQRLAPGETFDTSITIDVC